MSETTAQLVKKAEAGDGAACYRLGYGHLWGLNAPHDPTTALAWFQRGAALGSAECMRGEGEYWASQQDVTAAGRCFMRALEAGDQMAGANLGIAVTDSPSLAAQAYRALGVDAAYLARHGVVIATPDPAPEQPSSEAGEDFLRAAAHSDLAALKRHLAAGVSIDYASTRGTALHRAADLGLLRVARFLLERGPALDLLDDNQLTPLMCACSLGKKKGSDVALLLIEAGAKVSLVRESDGMTALKFAAQRATPAVVQALIAKGAAVDGPRGTDQTALMLAARANNVANLRALVEAGASVKRRCKLPWAQGWTAERLAEEEGAKAAAAFLRGLRC